MPLTSSASFLRTAFGLTGFHPAGVLCGTRHEGGPVSKPLTSDRDGAWLFFEEMARAAAELVPPGAQVMRPLEESDGLVDLSRRLYLDDFKASSNRAGQTLTTITAAEYRRFDPLKCIGDGRKISIQGLQRGPKPERLAVHYSYSSAAIRIEQTDSVAFHKNDPVGDFCELSVRFLRNDFLRRLFGFREKGEVPDLPWEADRDSPREYLDLALRLAGLFHLSNRTALLEGFMLLNLEQEDELPSFGPFVPVSDWYSLHFDAAAKPLLKRLDGMETDVSEIHLDAPNHLIMSLLSQDFSGMPKAALSIGWNECGFRVHQRRVVSSGLRVFPPMAELITLGHEQAEADLAAFERLDNAEKIGSLAAYYSLLAGEKRADC